MFQEIAVNVDEIYQLDFLKVIVFSCSTKGDLTVFSSHPLKL